MEVILFKCYFFIRCYFFAFSFWLYECDLSLCLPLILTPHPNSSRESSRLRREHEMRIQKLKAIVSKRLLTCQLMHTCFS